MSFLFDTNVISELARSQPQPSVIAFTSSLSQISLSVITIEEISYGLKAKPNLRIESWFDTFITAYCFVLPVTDAIAKLAGEIRGKLQTQGKPPTQAD
jgi:toxin FitB